MVSMTTGVSSFRCRSWCSSEIPACSPSSSSSSSKLPMQIVSKKTTTMRLRASGIITSSALQQSSTSTVSGDTAEKEDVKPAEKKVSPKPKPAGKAPAKPLPQMMEEDIIPALRAILEKEDDITELDLSFQDNRLNGSFVKKSNPYSFWAFFPSGGLTGPKGFSLSSYGYEASTVEPFLVDEKKITSDLVVFWVEKRLAAQGIIPVWKQQKANS